MLINLVVATVVVVVPGFKLETRTTLPVVVVVVWVLWQILRLESVVNPLI